MSTTFNLRSWSIDILNVTVIHHSSLWLSMCRSTMSTTFKSPIVVDRHTQFYCYPSFIIVTVDVSIDDVDDIQISDRGLSVIHHPSSIIHPCDCRNVDRRCRRPMIDDVKIVTDREYSILLLSIMVTVDMLIDDRGCKNRHRSWLSLYVDRRSTMSTMSTTDDDRFKKSNTSRQVLGPVPVHRSQK